MQANYNIKKLRFIFLWAVEENALENTEMDLKCTRSAKVKYGQIYRTARVL